MEGEDKEEEKQGKMMTRNYTLFFHFIFLLLLLSQFSVISSVSPSRLRLFCFSQSDSYFSPFPSFQPIPILCLGRESLK